MKGLGMGIAEKKKFPASRGKKASATIERRAPLPRSSVEKNPVQKKECMGDILEKNSANNYLDGPVTRGLRVQLLKRKEKGGARVYTEKE